MESRPQHPNPYASTHPVAGAGAMAPYPPAGGPYPPPTEPGYPPGWPPSVPPPGAAPFTGPGGPPRRPGRAGVWVAAGVVTLLLLTVLGLLVGTGVLGGDDPDAVVEDVSEEVRGWDSITYTGEVSQSSKGNVTVAITVDREGDMAGTLTKPNGGRADYARIDGVEMIKTDASWWKGDTDEADKVGRLAGTWLRNAGTETSGLTTAALDPPEELARDLGTPGGGAISMYSDRGPETVDGVVGRAIEGMGRRIVVSDESTPRLLAVQPTYSTTTSLLRVSRPDPAALAAIGEARTIRDTAANYQTKLYERAKVTVALLSGGPSVCVTETCSMDVRVTNTSKFTADGAVRVTLNDALKGYHPFHLAAGASATFTTTSRNLATPGTRVTANWKASASTY